MNGRDRRLLFEYDTLMRRFGGRKDVEVEVVSRNAADMPVKYVIKYNIRSICAIEHPEAFGTVGVLNPPIFADKFIMNIDIPRDYPCIDAQPSYRFVTVSDDGSAIPHPWHPNIRWFGSFAGRVCVNTPDTYTDIAWCVERIAGYLKYEIYHAINEPPFPEDQQVAAWVVRQGEPQGWLEFRKDTI